MSTIKSSREIDTVFKTASRVAHPIVIALVLRTPEGRDQSGRVAFVAGKKLGNAVKRNRCKRVLRAAVQRRGGGWPGFDVALIARPQLPIASGESVDKALEAIARRAGMK